MSLADKKRILKQFQWFQVQTKVREIISELIHPLQKKVLSNSTSISKLQELTHNEKHKLEQITLMVHNDQDIFKQGIFRNIQEKFHNQTVLIRELEKKIEYLENYVNSKAKVLDKRLEESTEVLNGINHFKDYVKTEFTNQSKKIIDSHANVLQNFDTINKEITEAHLQIDQIKLHQETLVKRVDLNEKIVKQANHRLDQRLLQFYQVIKEIKTVTQINGGHLIHMREEMLRMGSYQKILSKFQSLVNEQIIRIDNLQFKIEVIQPVISFTQINEYAHHILPEKYHKNISIYYYNKYKELVEEILNNNFEEKRLSESVKGNLQLIKQTHKRAIKLVFKLKKEQLMKKGVNIDLLSHQKKEQQLASMKIEEDFQGIDDVDPEITKKIVPQDDTPKATAEQIQNMHKELKEKIELQLKDSKKQIQHMEFLLKKDQQTLQGNIRSLSNSLTQLTLNCQLQQKLNRQSSTSIQKSLSFIRQQNKTMKLAMREIHDIMLIFNEIEKQDEKDRQGITLLGIRQHHKDEILQQYDRRTSQGHRSVVDLQPECLSCSGNPNYYNEFFKMACLTYTSSPIRYDNHLYNRIDILDRLQQQLQLIHGVLSDKGSRRHINELGLQTERKQSHTHRQGYAQEEMGSSRYGSSQIMKLPSRDVYSMSERYTARNVSSSQQIRTKNTPKSPEQPRIINPSELTSQMLSKTRNRFYNRKLERSIREKSMKKEESSQEKTEYMKNVSRYFKDLNKQNSGLL